MLVLCLGNGNHGLSGRAEVKWQRQPLTSDLIHFQVMVAEKKGRIRFYNLETRLPVMSLDCPKPPLLAADWSFTNPLTVGAVAGGTWFVWDTSRSSLPYDSHSAHLTAATSFRWCSTSDGVFATTSAGGQLKIHHYGHKKVGTGYSKANHCLCVCVCVCGSSPSPLCYEKVYLCPASWKHE